MAAAAAAVALDQQAVVQAFMRSDAVRPAEAILFVPKGSIQRSFFNSYVKEGIIKPEGARWFLDIPTFHAYRQKQRKRALWAVAVLAAGTVVAALL